MVCTKISILLNINTRRKKKKIYLLLVWKCARCLFGVFEPQFLDVSKAKKVPSKKKKKPKKFPENSL